MAAAAPESRVIALIGRDGVGKSKLCAAILDDAGADRFADKSRLLERESAENRRNFSCYTHTYSRQFRATRATTRLHLIDTPGHVDRLPLVEQALRTAHGAVVVSSLNTGIDAACGRVLAAAEASEKPLAVFVNGLDRASEQAQFEEYVELLEARLGLRPLVLFAPVYAPGHPPGSLVLDVLNGTLCSAFECAVGGSNAGYVNAAGVQTGEGFDAWAAALRERAVDALTEEDDELMEEYVESEGVLKHSSIEAALKRAVAARKVVPVVVGCAKTGLGVDALTEVMRNLFPALDTKSICAALGADSEFYISSSHQAPCVAWATRLHSHRGARLVEVQVLGGTMEPGQELHFVSGDGEPLRASKLLVAGVRGDLGNATRLYPGDLAFVPAPQSLTSLGAAGALVAAAEMPLVGTKLPQDSSSGQHDEVERCVFALKLSDLGHKEASKLMDALHMIEQDDEGLIVEEHLATHETRLHCMGLLHVELLRERLAEEFKVLHLPLAAPRVEYQATLRTKAVAKGEHRPEARTHIRKGIAHTHQGPPDAWTKIELEPVARGGGVEIEDSEIFETQHAMKQGIEEALQTAGPGGIPVTDVHVRVLGSEFAKEAKEDAAVAAAACAVQEALRDASRVSLLEPIATLEVDVPGTIADDVVADLRARGSDFLYTQPAEGDDRLVSAELPLREIVNYPSDLKKLSGGEGFCSYKVQAYRELPQDLQKEFFEHEAA